MKGLTRDIKTDRTQVPLEKQRPVAMGRKHQKMSGRNDLVAAIVQNDAVLGRQQCNGQRVIAGA